jgi:tetratricopeptide (TPR) repeat protein
MQTPETEAIFASGVKMLAQGDTLAALSLFEKAVQMEDRPIYSSYYAFCIAKERGQFQLAVTLCQKAMAKEPLEPAHYLNLGKIFLIAGKKDDAIRTFREGLHQEHHQQIIDELNAIGTRKPPLFPFLKRSNPLNKYLGVILKRLGIRR